VTNTDEETHAMASVHKDFTITAHPDVVWDAVRDFGAVHQRLNPGFVVDCRLEGTVRILTFHNGVVAREELVDCDDTQRRLVYAIIGGERVRHYNGAVQVLSDGESRTRMTWVVDVLPNDIAPYIASQMDIAIAAMQKTLGR
jgi:carbon monoxide dehydrogenase subunit G